MKLASSLILTLFATTTLAAPFNIPEICESSVHSLVSEYTNGELGASDALLQKPAEALANEVVLFTNEPEVLPWYLQDVSRPNVLKAAYLVQLRLAQVLVDDFTPGVSPRAVLERASLQPAKYSQAALDQANTALESIRSSPPSDDTAGDKLKNNGNALCLPYFSFDCGSALVAAFDIVGARAVSNSYVSVGVNVSRLDALTPFMTDPSLVQGFSAFALRLMDNVENGRPLGKNLFEDLKSSFMHFGQSSAQAEESAWTILTFYSTRGASIAMFEGIVNQENLPMWVAEYMMSTAIGVTDEKTAPLGHAYSYPSEIQGTCKMDRPYHFWMAASLVRSLIKQGFSAKGSAAATHILGKLYEFGAGVSGRKGDRIYQDPYMSAYPQMVRIGLAYKTAGVLWAANLAKSPLDFDGALTEILSQSSAISPKTDDELKKANDLQKYLWFTQVIAPDAALKKYGPY